MTKTTVRSPVGEYLEIHDSETGMKARVRTVVLIDPDTGLPYRSGGTVGSGGASDTLEATQQNVKAAVQSMDSKLPALSAGKVPVTDPTALPLPTGAATSAAQAAGNASLASVDGKLPALSAGKVPVTDPTALPLPTGAATSAAQTAGNASLASVDSKTSALGAAAPSASSAVSLPNCVVVGAAASIAALNIDLLTGNANGWYDAANFRSVSLQLIAAAGITAGAITFEQTNDISAAAAGNVWPVEESTVLTPTPNIAAVTIAASTTRMFGGAVTARFVRVRVSTAFAGGNVQCVAVFSQLPYWRQVMTVHQDAAANLNMTATLAASATAIGDVGQQVRANSTGAATVARVTSAATTNATSVKTSAGRVVGWRLFNTSATTTKFLKLYNKATAPTVGTDVPLFIVPLSAGIGQDFNLPAGIGFPVGIAYAITGAVADSDKTAVAANDVVGALFYG